MRRIAEKMKHIHLFKSIPWLWMLAGFLYNIWYQIYPGKYILDADLASEMVLADHLNETGQILSKNWFYSSELRVFQSQWFYRIGLMIFPDNWHCARIVASALLLVVFAVAIMFCAHFVGMKQYGVWCAAILMWPFGAWYLVYGLYGTYYLIYMFFSLLVLGILLWLNRKKGLKTIPLYVCGIFLAFAAGLNGVKQTFIFFAPLFLVAFLLCFLAIRERKPHTCKELQEVCSCEIKFFWQTVVLVFSNLMGYLVNSRILSKIYSFKEFNELTWAWGLPNRLYDVWLDFFLLFGHQRKVNVVSLWGIVSILGLILGVSVAFSIVRLCKHYNRLSMGYRVVLLLNIATLVVGGVVFCLIGEYKDYYWLPLVPFSIAIVLMEIQTEDFSMNHAREVILVGVMISISLLSAGTVKQEMKAPLFGQVGYNEVADWLVENNYTQGYALFWNSNVLREMSDGKIETWTIYSGENDFIYEWLQEVEHTTTKPTYPYFLFVNSRIGGGPEYYKMLQNGEGTLVYKNDPFYIYVFEK